MKATLLASVLGASFLTGMSISQSAAQATATYVAYIEAARGRIVASSEGKPTLLEALDIIADRTQMDLQPNSELRICHYLTRKLLTLRGPLRAWVAASGVTSDGGAATQGPFETCAPPGVLSFQGGLFIRTAGTPTVKVSLQAAIKVVNRGMQGIRRIALWDDLHENVLMDFNGTVAYPNFQSGVPYLLVIERSDGSELKTMLLPSAVQNVPLIVVVP
jgi:hypothetical protein